MKPKKKSNKKKKKIDIRYIGVPNICFSLLSKGDEREKQFRKQRIKQGFDESETWSLSDTICNFIIPRLKMFIEVTTETKSRDKEFIGKCEKMLVAFELLARDKGIRLFTDEEKKKVNKGLALFSKLFESLWW